MCQVRAAIGREWRFRRRGQVIHLPSPSVVSCDLRGTGSEQLSAVKSVIRGHSSSGSRRWSLLRVGIYIPRVHYGNRDVVEFRNFKGVLFGPNARISGKDAKGLPFRRVKSEIPKFEPRHGKHGSQHSAHACEWGGFEDRGTGAELGLRTWSL